MKAVHLSSPRMIGIAEIPEPVRDGGTVKLKIESVGICGSDIAAYRGTSPLCTYPRVIGHELVGTVMEADIGPTALREGERVVVEPYIPCGRCYPCGIGRTNCCQHLEVIGVHRDGGMCEFICHPAQLLHRVPDSIPLAELALIEPLSIAVHAARRLGITKGEHVVILGAGPIGNLTAQVCLASGAIPIMVDILGSRLLIAESVGVEFCVNSSKEDVARRVAEITVERMAECVVEATGAQAAIRSTPDLASFAGRIALVGWPKNELPFPTGTITLKELDIRGSRNSAGDFPRAIELIASGLVNVSPSITKVVSLDELPESIAMQSDRPDEYMKIVGLF
jgi:2-desacetyl-2-hydroxyethyl bacteriochlorophyllide A dehydrogenase